MAAIGPQPTGHRTQRRGLVTEPLGDLVERLVIDEDRAESLVAALEGLVGLEEEPPGVALVHDAYSRVLIIFWAETKPDRTAKTEAEKASKWP
jgi:hypothetical protein